VINTSILAPLLLKKIRTSGQDRLLYNEKGQGGQVLDIEKLSSKVELVLDTVNWSRKGSIQERCSKKLN